MDPAKAASWFRQPTVAAALMLAPFAAFALFLIVTGVSKWPRARAIVYTLTKRSTVYDYLCAYDNVPPVLVAGSSTGKYGVVPEELRKALKLSEGEVANISWDAATPLAIYASLQRHANQIPSMGMVLLSLDDRILSESYYFNRPIERVLWSYPEYAEVKREMRMTDTYTAPYRSLFHHYLNSSSACDYPRNQEAGLIKKTGDYFDNLEQLRFLHLGNPPSEVQLEYLAMIKKFVEDHGGTFLLFVTPKHESYLEQRRKSGPQAYNAALLAGLKRHLGEGQLIYGANDLTGYSSKKDYFADPVHLNHRGAVAFSNDLVAALRDNAFRPLAERNDYF